MTKNERILIVDDEASIRFFLSESLNQAGYSVESAASGEEALTYLQKHSADLVLLDLKMVGINGLTVMQNLEKLNQPPAIIILTAHASLDSAIQAMRLGSDDYLIKPCHTEILLAAVERSLVKHRKNQQRQQMIRLIENTARELQSDHLAPQEIIRQARFVEGRGLLIDREIETVSSNGIVISLTPTEYRLLTCFMEHEGQPVNYVELVILLYGATSGQWSEADARRALSTHIWRLKSRLGNAPDGKPYIVNVRGKGYKFIGEKS